VSLYAATKRADELMSISYAKLYGFPMSGLRFFTVYGPWGRPDMAYYGFTQKILKGEPIEVYGEGKMARDFTYIDDIVDGVVGVLDNPPAQGGHEIYNIGDNDPVGLMEMITTLEAAIGREAVKIMRPMQPGDVTATYADISKLRPDRLQAQGEVEGRPGPLRRLVPDLLSGLIAALAARQPGAQGPAGRDQAHGAWAATMAARICSACSGEMPMADSSGEGAARSQAWRPPIVTPPSTTMWVPVTNSESSLAR
jgi:hypothetical protein